MSPRELSYDRRRLERLRRGAVLVVGEPAVFWVEGPGALPCLQGLLTNDLEKPGEHSLVYGALLTPKGAIVVDHWVFREPERFVLIAPINGRLASVDLFQRQLPPRLARVSDATGQVEVAWLVGGQAFAALARSPVKPIPDAAGRTVALEYPHGRLLLGLAPEPAPFAAIAVGPRTAIRDFARLLDGAGVEAGTPEDAEAARILAGWPALGAEIDDRTLPQEVRYDEVGGVSYTKGCYVGQETVARLHFRGHTNRELRGLVWREGAGIAGTEITASDRQVGTIRSTLALDDRLLGLAPIRREVSVGDEVDAGGKKARVVALPFGAEDLDG
jgi:tRNA-modifying protein YgfZ